MSAAVSVREEILLTEATVAIPALDTVEPALRPVRKRRSAPRKAAVVASDATAVEKAVETQTPAECGPSDRNANLLAGYRRALAVVQRAWQWLQARRQWQLASRRMALCETVSLGEKRFLAIVKVDSQQFLVGGAAGSVSMLAQLNGRGEFGAILQQQRKRGGANQ
ncbi:MAG TPA: flagellar biosynthetic protein FliO [Candidatus Angelobacter sp.]|jgi:hypothetical protein|nr:flagellar biosynthetic protein FliO [Candidatus Angelobacter sp.]